MFPCWRFVEEQGFEVVGLEVTTGITIGARVVGGFTVVGITVPLADVHEDVVGL